MASGGRVRVASPPTIAVSISDTAAKDELKDRQRLVPLTTSSTSSHAFSAA